MIYLIAPCNRFPTSNLYTAGAWSYFLITADVNEDNKPDIITTNAGSKTIGIYLNNGGGIFALPINYSTGNEPRHLVAADVNGDSKVDIIVANRWANNIGVFLNNGNGMFAPQVTYSAGINPQSLAAADVNGDSKIDIIVANELSNNVGVFLNNGIGTFAPQATYSTGSNSAPNSVTTADVNGDSKVDIIVANRLANNIGVFLNNGNAMFASQVTYSTGVYGPIWVAAADVNADNRVDLIVMNTGTGSNIVNVLLSACI